MSENGDRPQAASSPAEYRILAPQAPLALQDLLSDLGYAIELREDGKLHVGTADLEKVAAELATLIDKDPPWGWRYLQSVLNGSVGASARLTQAIFAWGAVLDGAAPILANTQDVNVRAHPGQLHPGAVVLAKSKRCKNTRCRVAFVPKVPWQDYCRPECGVEYRKELRSQK